MYYTYCLVEQEHRTPFARIVKHASEALFAMRNIQTGFAVAKHVYIEACSSWEAVQSCRVIVVVDGNEELYLWEGGEAINMSQHVCTVMDAR